MLASERFTEEAVSLLRDAIADAGGNEVFAAGKLNDQGLVAEIQIAARGNAISVLALPAWLNKADIVIHNHPSGHLVPSEPDMQIAARVGSAGNGAYIVNNEVTEVYVVVEPTRRTPLIAINPDEIAGVLETGGKLARKLYGYEPRQSQIELVRAVANTMNEGSILAAEAGTGVGKSFAYLLPAFAWAVRNKERIVVSTATINLQKQLLDKDIPVVASIFKKQLKAVLVKGRGNYLCLHRLQEALDEEGMFADSEHPLRIIDAWSKNTDSGDRSDLAVWPEDNVWNRVCSESDSCLGLRCPFRENCFVLHMKKESADANILVVNHHILFSDLSARKSGAGYEDTAVLPPFSTIVFDEAHSIESSATSYFSNEVIKFSLFKQLSRLYHERRERKFGILVKLQNLQGIPPELFKKLPECTDRIREATEFADQCGLAFLADQQNVRLLNPSPEVDNLVIKPLKALEQSLLTLAQLLKDIVDEVSEDNRKEQVVWETQLATMRLQEQAKVCARFDSWQEEDDFVFWLEKGRTSKDEAFACFRITPLNISSLMTEAVYEPFRCNICVSATLTVGGNFDFWKHRVGLHLTERTADYHIFPSPFPYEETALLAAVREAPMPNENGWQDFINAAVADLLEASQGHALVLFTSYSSLRSCWDAVKPKLDAAGITALRQGDDERTRLLNAFKKDHASVLFATDSFWEGVDAPGSTLQMVIITKLPFSVPTDPVQKARADAIERHGGNAFVQLSLPEAVIKFKQGFGRLIRHSDDAGAVVVLDSRLLKKSYGRIFIESLPKTQTSFKPLPEICRDVQAFLEKARRGSKE